MNADALHAARLDDRVGRSGRRSPIEDKPGNFRVVSEDVDEAGTGSVARGVTPDRRRGRPAGRRQGAT